MSRTHILAGEGNVGYTDHKGSPLISAVTDTTVYSACGTGTNLCPSHLTVSVTEQFARPGTWLHFTVWQRHGGFTCDWKHQTKAVHLVCPSFICQVYRKTGRGQRSQFISFLTHSKHLSAFVLQNTDLRTALMEGIWTGQGETDPSTALEGFTWNFSPQLHAGEESHMMDTEEGGPNSKVHLGGCL